MASLCRVAMVLGRAAALAPWIAAAAQADPPVPRPITWCSPVAANPVWERYSISLSLATRRSHVPGYQEMVNALVDSTSLVKSAPEADGEANTSPEELERVLSALRESFATVSGLDYAGTGTPGHARLPAADSRYAPTAIASALYFVLLGTGAVDSVRFNGGPDSTLMRDMAEALRLTVESGHMPQLGPAMSVRHLSWTPVTSARPGAAWPAFTLDFPKRRPALAIRMGQPRYADERWNATVTLQYLVGIDGRAVPASIRPTTPADKLGWDNEAQKKAYLAFEETSEDAVRKAIFQPEEYFGCLQAMWVQQEFIYKHH